MLKNGQIQVQLNWIFVLIAGAIILTFFVSMILVFKGGSEEQLNYKVLSKLDTLFTGAGVSVGTTSLIEIPKAEIEFSCDAFRISQAKIDFGKRLVFSPSRLEGDRLVTFTHDWSVPFRVDNFLFVTSPQVAYYFIYDSEQLLAEEEFEKLPPSLMAYNDQEEIAFNKKLLHIGDVGNLTYKGNYLVRFVFFDGDPTTLDLSAFDRLQNHEVTALSFEGSGLKGIVNFFQRSEEGDFALINSSTYVGKAGLYGAMFMDNHFDYNCVMSKAFQRLNKVARVYQLRSKVIQDEYVNTGCHMHYDTSLFDPLVKDFSFFNAEQYSAGLLMERNNVLLQEACALLY
jgi:hypothetical protein